MRFEMIKLKNFRQYRDETIKFEEWESDRNITVIQGAMGAGKTNIMNAITWCFYGDEKHLTSRSSKGLGICNTAATSALRNGDSCEVEVELVLTDADQNNIYVRRSQRFEKDYQNDVKLLPYIVKGEKLETMFQVDRVVDGETHKEMNPTAFIERLVPEDISPYFFFDGDKLNEYFEERSSTMADAVEIISQIDLLDLVIRHLGSAERDMVKHVKDPTEELRELTAERESYEKKVKANQKIIKELKAKQTKMESEIKEIDEFLGERAVGEAKEKSLRREKLEREIATKKGRLKDLESDRLEVCMDWGPIALAYPALVKTVQLVQDAEHAGKLPAAYKKNFLERMLKERLCICGSSLAEGTEHREEIEKRLAESDDLSDLSENLAHLSGRLRTNIERFSQGYSRLVKLHKLIKQAKEDIDEANDEKAKIEKALIDVHVEEVSKKEAERQTLRSKSLNTEREIAILEHEVSGWQKNIRDLKNLISRAMSRNKKFKDDVRKREICEKAIDDACDIRDSVIAEIRREIEKLTEKYFLETHWKKGTYSKVTIDDNYSVSVKDNTGQEALGTLSRGETQVLAYAFVIALNIVSGFDFPLVIDTPLGRISSEPRVALGKALSSSLKGRQLVFLMTDVEYTSDIKRAVQSSVASEYNIDFAAKSDKVGGEARLVRAK